MQKSPGQEDHKTVPYVSRTLSNDSFYSFTIVFFFVLIISILYVEVCMCELDNAARPRGVSVGFLGKLTSLYLVFNTFIIFT